MCTLIDFVQVEAYPFGKRSEYIFYISYHRFMCLCTSLLDLKEWSYDTDQASYQILFGFHFPPTHYHCSCESNPAFHLFENDIPIKLLFYCGGANPFFSLTECMYTVKRNSD